MARVFIPNFGFGWIADTSGNAQAGVSVQIKNLDGTAATHWSAATGGSSSTAAISSQPDGTLARYIETGTYTITVAGVDKGRIEAVAGDTVAGKPLGTTIQYVDADNGDDSADGLSWGTAKETLAAAHADMPAGGRIYLNCAQAEYNVTSALDWGGFHVEGIGRATGLGSSFALIRHKYSGNLFDFGAKGGFLRNVLLYEDDVTAGRTGAAIAGTSSASAGGTILCENVIISAGSTGSVGWERDVVLDGSAWTTFGIRKCEFVNCQFFGCRTAGETIKITRGVHCKFVNCFVDPAPTAVTQGVKLIDTGSTDVQFANVEVLGNFSTEAAGEVTFTGRITGTVTCQASSDKNVFVGPVGTFTNSGGGGNVHLGPAGLTIGDVKLYRLNANQWAIDDRFIVVGTGAGTLGVTVRNGSNNVVNISDDGLISMADGVGGSLDTVLFRWAAGIWGVTSLFDMPEVAAPSAPASNRARLFVRDNGSGKTQLCAIFPTGAIQVIATEP